MPYVFFLRYICRFRFSSEKVKKCCVLVPLFMLFNNLFFYKFSSSNNNHCVVFLGKTLNSHSASLHSGVLMDICEPAGKPDEMLGADLRLTRIPSRSTEQCSRSLYATETGESRAA